MINVEGFEVMTASDLVAVLKTIKTVDFENDTPILADRVLDSDLFTDDEDEAKNVLIDLYNELYTLLEAALDQEDRNEEVISTLMGALSRLLDELPERDINIVEVMAEDLPSVTRDEAIEIINELNDQPMQSYEAVNISFHVGSLTLARIENVGERNQVAQNMEGIVRARLTYLVSATGGGES